MFQMFIFALWLLVVQKHSFFGLILQLIRPRKKTIDQDKMIKEYGNTLTYARGVDLTQKANYCRCLDCGNKCTEQSLLPIAPIQNCPQEMVIENC